MDIFKTIDKAGLPDGQTCRIPLTHDERELCKQSGYVPKFGDITWRVFRIMAEFVEGFQFLSSFSREVTVMGSARIPASNRWYQEAVRLGKMLADNGFTVVTGGGPGIMEAANKGAYEAGGKSVGINIQLPREQRINPFVKESKAFHYFFTRKVILTASAQTFVYFPGGYGTLDELFEMLTLMQTKKIEKVPVVLVGKEFWGGLLEWIQQTVYERFDAIDRLDMNLFTLVDTAEEAFAVVKTSHERVFF